MKVVMTPNPYRDKQFRVAEQAQSILEAEGVTVRMCLPFEVDKSYPLPSGIHFYDLKKEIRDAQMLICFGGDGTILHASKFATANHIPVLGVNIGTMGFIAELESSELELLKKIPSGDYTLEPRSMLDVKVTNGTQQLFHETALNDAVITKGAIARATASSSARRPAPRPIPCLPAARSWSRPQKTCSSRPSAPMRCLPRASSSARSA